MKAITVDDSKTIRAIVKRTLKGLGFEVEEAEDGLVALEKIKQAWPIDLAVVDWNMPNMNGIELVREIRRRPEWSGMRVMMATTESEISQMQLALEAGADEYLMKPFDREALEQKLVLLGLVV
ncbi:response regulator [Myxococcota bacterium]|nr:response regulator [Deltaproteobacteria bacterium]MBY0401509.1 response regulator [Myxococcota bacterium]